MTDAILTLTEDQNINLVQSIILLVFLGAGLIAHFRSSPGTAIKQASIWLIIICVIVIGYSFRHDAKNLKNRLVGELVPSLPVQNQDGSLSFRISVDGHYHIKTEINHREVEFLLDTGASDVVLTMHDAKKIGINPRDLNFTKIYNTANGKVSGAPIRLNKIIIGDYIITNVRASVNQAEMNKSLLGMSFLEKLQGYEVRNEILTIWP